MQFIVKNTKKDNVYNLMRDINYHFVSKAGRNGEMNFVHPIRGNTFPRFHIFAKIDGEKFIFNLHLDQRAPVYGGVAAHEGEYSGELIEKEAERIKKALL